MITRNYFVAGSYEREGKHRTFWKAFGHRSFFEQPVRALTALLVKMEDGGATDISITAFSRV